MQCVHEFRRTPVTPRTSAPLTSDHPLHSAPINRIHYAFEVYMTPAEPIFATVEEAVEEIRQGRMIVLAEDEGHLTLAAEKITPEAINFMAKYGRGLICLALPEQRCDELHLPLMSLINT